MKTNVASVNDRRFNMSQIASAAMAANVTATDEAPGREMLTTSTAPGTSTRTAKLTNDRVNVRHAWPVWAFARVSTPGMLATVKGRGARSWAAATPETRRPPE